MAEALGQIAGTLLFMFVVMLVVGGVYYLMRRPRITFWRGLPVVGGAHSRAPGRH